MVIAVVAVLMMKMSLEYIVLVIAMRHLVMSTALMPAGTGHRRTAVGIDPADGDRMLIVMVPMWRVQVPIMQVIDVALMLYSKMATRFAVHVRVIAMGLMLCCHDSSRALQKRFTYTPMFSYHP